MYVIRRVWEVKRREARKAASIAADIGKDYEDAGQRASTTVYFNGGTLPGEKDRIYMQWTAEVIDSPYGRDDNPGIPKPASWAPSCASSPRAAGSSSMS